MLKKRVLIVSFVCLFAVISCVQSLVQSDDPMIEGTIENPMAMIEEFAKQTAAAQTRIADPVQPSILLITPIQPSYSIDQKLVFVVFPDGRKISYSPSEIGSLPQTTTVVNGAEMSGVTLITFLQNAGWDEFNVSAISLNGIGSLTLPREQITQDDLLVLTGYSIKFISPSVPESLWIDGVIVIEIY